MTMPNKKKCSKAQYSTEFIILASFMVLVVLGFFVVSSSKVVEFGEERNKRVAEDIANFIYKEVETARSVNDGYVRLFAVPQTIDGINYSITITDNRELTVNYLDIEYVKLLPSGFVGNITKGLNLISKIKGIVYLNLNAAQLPQQGIVGLIMKNSARNVVNFDDNGNVVLLGVIETNAPNARLQPTSDDEFIVKDSSGNIVTRISLVSGNMYLKGVLQQKQISLNPNSQISNFIIKDVNGNVVAYIDENGNLYLQGTLTQSGNP